MTLAGEYNGLSFGPGSDVHVAGMEGVEDLPPVRSTDVLRANDEGSFLGSDYLGSREVVMTYHLIADNQEDYEVIRDLFKAAMVPSTSVEIPLKIYGSTKRINCRVRRRNVPVFCDKIQDYTTAIVQFVASDPRLYSESESSQTVGLPTSSGGLDIPADVPWVLGAASSGGIITAVNEGNFPTLPIAVITGPADNPRLENVTQGKTVQFNLSLGASDTLTIDFAAHSVLLNGTASRRSTMTSSSQWWDLQPGTSTIRFNANAYDPSSSVLLTWRSSWI